MEQFAITVADNFQQFHTTVIKNQLLKELQNAILAFHDN